MVRKTMKMLALAFVAVLALSSMAEAATKHVVHRRPKHSTRVSTGTVRTSKPVGKHAGVKRASAKKSAVKHRTTTKPR